MPKSKIICIMLFLIKQAVSICTRADLMEQVNIGMDIYCDQNNNNPLVLCKVICIDKEMIIDGLNSNAVDVQCKNNEWTYISSPLSRLTTHQSIHHFTCVNPLKKTLCSFEELDNNAISVIGISNDQNEDIYVKITCIHDERIVMKAKCHNNQWQTNDGDKFDEAFYRHKCSLGCYRNRLDNTLNKHPGITHDCVNSEYGYGDSCAIYCTNKNYVFQTNHPMTSIEVLCEGVWKLQNIGNSNENISEETLNEYSCAQMGNDIKLCSLDSLDSDVVKVNEYLEGFAEGQKTVITCLHNDNRNPLEIYCRDNGFVLNNYDNGIALTEKYLIEYCKVGCLLDDLLNAIGQDVTLKCEEKFYEVGEGCSAYCSETRAFFEGPHPSTKVNLQCEQTWHREWENKSFVSLFREETDTKLTCKKLKQGEFYCSLEDVKPFANFPPEYKGLVKNQKIKVTCKNKNNLPPYTISCDYLLEQDRLFKYCNASCNKNLLDNISLDLDHVPEITLFRETLVLKCRGYMGLYPLDVFCDEDSLFHFKYFAIVTIEYTTDYCKGYCSVNTLNHINPYLARKIPSLKFNETIDVPCPRGNTDTVQFRCGKDRNLYNNEYSGIIEKENFFEYCEFKCRSWRGFSSMFDSSVTTSCNTESEFIHKCSVTCKDPNHILYSTYNARYYDRTSNTKLFCEGRIFIRFGLTGDWLIFDFVESLMCTDGCVIGEPYNKMNEFVNLDFSKSVYQKGESFYAHCKQPGTLFDIPDPTTRIKLHCDGGRWFVQYKSTYFEFGSKELRCRSVKNEETFCEIDSVEPLASYPPEYKGLGKNQVLEFACRDIQLEKGLLVCADTNELSSYEIVDRYCNYREKCSLGHIDEKIISFENDFRIIGELQTIKGNCVNLPDITIEFICVKNNDLRIAGNGKEATNINIMQTCQHGCSEQKFNDLNKNHLELITKDCFPSTIQGDFKRESCRLRCKNNKEILLYCIDNEFQYHSSDGVNSPAVLLDTLLICIENGYVDYE